MLGLLESGDPDNYRDCGCRDSPPLRFSLPTSVRSLDTGALLSGSCRGEGNATKRRAALSTVMRLPWTVVGLRTGAGNHYGIAIVEALADSRSLHQAW